MRSCCSRISPQRITWTPCVEPRADLGRRAELRRAREELRDGRVRHARADLRAILLESARELVERVLLLRHGPIRSISFSSNNLVNARKLARSPARVLARWSDGLYSGPGENDWRTVPESGSTWPRYLCRSSARNERHTKMQSTFEKS